MKGPFNDIVQYSCKYKLKTDHKSSVKIYPSYIILASGRIQRWVLKPFEKGIRGENTTVDAASRLPLPVIRANPAKPAEVV